MAGSSVTLVEKTDDELDAWLPASWTTYVDARVRSGESREHAQRVAGTQREATFPDGRPSPGHVVFNAIADGRTVGTVWIGTSAQDESGDLFLYEIEIDEHQRGKGFGRAAMLAAESWARDHGARRLSLNVFGHNVRAKSLYDSLGYRTAATFMQKDL